MFHGGYMLFNEWQSGVVTRLPFSKIKSNGKKTDCIDINADSTGSISFSMY
jgi:hypothetical protein